MASIPAPLAPRWFSPAWWHTPKVRARLLGAGVLALAYGVGLGYGSWTRVCAAERCPSISRLLSGPGPQQTSKVYAADGRLMTEVGLERRTVLRLQEIPPFLRQAFIATEDKRFYSHHGIDYWRIFGAIKADLQSLGWAQGFSTITMQARPEHFSGGDLAREEAHAQAEGGARRDGDRAQFPERHDPPAVSEPDRPRLRLARGRGGRADLLREVGAPAQHGGSRDARRAPEGSRLLQPPHAPRPCRAAAATRCSASCATRAT